MKYFKHNKPGKLSVYGMLLLCLFLPGLSLAESLVVIVNPLSPVQQLSRSEVINIYMGRQKKLGQNDTALPLDLGGINPTKKAFYLQLLNKQLSEINSYWARLMFSGQGSPPRQLDSVSDIKQTIRNNIGAIGYLPYSEVPDDLRIVFILKEN